VWRRDEYWAKARRAFRLWDPGAEDSCVGGWDPRSWLGNHLPSPSWFWPASLKIFMSDESLQEKRCGGWGKERKAEERPESEEVVVSSKEAHVPDHSSCRKDGAISSLNMAIEGLNLAKELSIVTPAKAVFGSVSVLLAMIRVCFPLFSCDEITQAHLYLGHHGQQTGLRRTRAGLCGCMRCP